MVFGDSEFGDPLAGLAQVATQVEELDDGAPEASPEVQAAETARAAEVEGSPRVEGSTADTLPVRAGQWQGGAAPTASPTATPGGSPAGEADANEPEAEVTLKEWKLRAAARMIVPGAASWNVKDKTHYPKGTALPTATAMKWEVLQRDSTARPTYWPVEKLCTWLHDHAVPATVPPIILPETETETAETATAGDDGWKRVQWVAKRDFPRLCHVIVELKEAFLKRDAKPKDRHELESMPRNAFWQKAAKKHNDPTFKPTKLTGGHDILTQVAFDELCVDHDPIFTVDAALLMKHWGEARKLLVQTMANFRKSGQGDDGVGIDIATSNTVYSSEFANFCGGKPGILYLYHLFMPHGLLDSAQVDMPIGTTHASDGNHRHVSGPRPNTSASTNAKWSRLVDALEKPVTIRQTASQKAVDYYDARVPFYHTIPPSLPLPTSLLLLSLSLSLSLLLHSLSLSLSVWCVSLQVGASRATLAREELAALKEANYEKVMAKIKEYGQSPVPTYLMKKRDRLETELEEMEDAWEDEEVPIFTDDAASSAKKRGKQTYDEDMDEHEDAWDEHGDLDEEDGRVSDEEE